MCTQLSIMVVCWPSGESPCHLPLYSIHLRAYQLPSQHPPVARLPEPPSQTTHPCFTRWSFIHCTSSNYIVISNVYNSFKQNLQKVLYATKSYIKSYTKSYMRLLIVQMIKLISIHYTSIIYILTS